MSGQRHGDGLMYDLYKYEITDWNDIMVEGEPWARIDRVRQVGDLGMVLNYHRTREWTCDGRTWHMTKYQAIQEWAKVGAKPTWIWSPEEYGWRGACNSGAVYHVVIRWRWLRMRRVYELRDAEWVLVRTFSSSRGAIGWAEGLAEMRS